MTRNETHRGPDGRSPRARLAAWLTLLAVLSPTCLIAQGGASEAAKPLPLEADSDALRSFKLSTQSVTWLSVDVSPDGTTLVVDALGDLFTLPIEGGAGSLLSGGLAFDGQPSFSPDGEWIAFISDRDGAGNVWIMPASGGDAIQLTRDKSADFASPTWSADGSYVIASRIAPGHRTNELWMYHRDGGTGVRITVAMKTPKTPRSQQHNALGAVASPDGRFLYYARRLGGFEYNADFPMWQVARRDLESGDEDILTAAPGSAVRPVLSPDGQTLVYATRRDNETGLRVRSLTSGEERWLRYPVQRDEQESTFSRDLYPGYDFTPDGSALIVTWEGGLHRLDLADGTASAIDFHLDLDLPMGPSLVFPRRVETGPVRARVLQGAARAGDGDAIVASALGRVWIQEAAGSPVRRLSAEDQRAYQPSFSPDGLSVVYVSWSRDGGHLWRVPVDGGAPVRLTSTPGFYSQPTWSPFADRIVALRGPLRARLEMPDEFGGGSLALDLVWIDAGGGDVQLIAPARGVGRPHFGPESDRVYVYSGDGLQSMRFDGTERRVHLQVVGPGLYSATEPVPAADLRMSPDGKWALADLSHHLYLVALPVIGGASPKVDLAKPSVPLRKLSALGADGFNWADDGETITWSLGSSFFSLDRSSVDFPRVKPKAPDEAAETAVSVTVDFPEAQRRDLVVEIERPVPRGTLVLRGARIVTMNGSDGGVIEDGDIVVTGDRVVAVGARGSVEIPSGATEISVQGKTIVPGFVDTHAHWIEIRRGVLDPEAWPFLANLAWGVTTGLDVQTMSNDMFAYQDLIDLGEVLGPRAFSTGPGVFSNNAFKSLEEAESVLRRYRDHYRTFNIKAYLSGNRQQRQWIAQAARKLGMMPTTEGGLDLALDLTHAIDGFAGNEHSLPVVPLQEDVVQLYAQSGIGYTPTLLVAYGGPWAENYFYTTESVHDRDKLRRFVPHGIIDGVSRKRAWFRDGEHIFPRLAESAARIVRAGGKVGVGSHGQLQGLGYHWELWALHSGGLSEVEALRVATLGGAEIIGLAQDVGSLEIGKLADLVVLNENPLDDIRNTDSVHSVMKGGELYVGETLDRVWPEPRELPELWWHSEEAELDADLERANSGN